MEVPGELTCGGVLRDVVHCREEGVIPPGHGIRLHLLDVLLVRGCV